ncbi:hypothetical protein ACJX0J_010443, partial [Zea mays]
LVDFFSKMAIQLKLDFIDIDFTFTFEHTTLGIISNFLLEGITIKALLYMKKWSILPLGVCLIMFILALIHDGFILFRIWFSKFTPSVIVTSKTALELFWVTLASVFHHIFEFIVYIDPILNLTSDLVMHFMTTPDHIVYVPFGDLFYLNL